MVNDPPKGCGQGHVTYLNFGTRSRLFVGCILYADDIILLAQIVSDLQKMLDICNKCLKKL